MDVRGYGDGFAWERFSVGIDGSDGVVTIFDDPREGIACDEFLIDLLAVDIDIVAEEFQVTCAVCCISHIIEHEHELLLTLHVDGEIIGTFREFSRDEHPSGWSHIDGSRSHHKRFHVLTLR